MKNIIISLLIIIVIGGGLYFFLQGSGEKVDSPSDTDISIATTTEDTTQMMAEQEDITSIGTSAKGNDIMAYHFGTGTTTELLFIGGIHGGYSWNTALVAYELITYLEQTPDVIPENVRVTVIPVLNPDGLNSVVGTTSKFSASDITASEEVKISGRFNGNTVDLNRNFDCDWQTTGTWQSKSVDGGSAPFSEPESAALKSYIESHNPTAVVVWYSAAGGVFASNCHNGVLEETRTLVNEYAKASGYQAYEEFDFYAVTGDLTNWLAKKGTPAISVLLSTHEDTEWTKNRAGVKALLDYFAR